MATFSLRAARTAFRMPVTYRSSDPSRVRFVYLGRSLDEVTAAPEDNIAVEALADSADERGQALLGELMDYAEAISTGA